MAILADDLLLGLKDRGIIPSNQSQLTDARFLAMADRLVESFIVPLLDSVSQEYLVVSSTTPVVASQSLYAIPYRAIARGLREVKVIDSAGAVRNLPMVALEDASQYDWQTSPVGFYIAGDQLRLIPDVPSTLSQALTLAYWWRCPPSKLIASSSAGLVTAVTATTVTVSNLPTSITTGSTVDFVQAKAGCGIYAFDKTISGVSNSTLTFAAGDIPSTNPSALAVGDYVCPAGYSPVLNFVPNECFSYLETLLTDRVLTSIGDEAGAKALKDTLKMEKENLSKIIAPRVQGEPIIIINRSSLVRGNKFSQRPLIFGA